MSAEREHDARRVPGAPQSSGRGTGRRGAVDDDDRPGAAAIPRRPGGRRAAAGRPPREAGEQPPRRRSSGGARRAEAVTPRRAPGAAATGPTRQSGVRSERGHQEQLAAASGRVQRRELCDDGAQDARGACSRGPTTASPPAPEVDDHRHMRGRLRALRSPSVSRRMHPRRPGPVPTRTRQSVRVAPTRGPTAERCGDEPRSQRRRGRAGRLRAARHRRRARPRRAARLGRRVSALVRGALAPVRCGGRTSDPTTRCRAPPPGSAGRRTGRSARRRTTRQQARRRRPAAPPPPRPAGGAAVATGGAGKRHLDARRRTRACAPGVHAAPGRPPAPASSATRLAAGPADASASSHPAAAGTPVGPRRTPRRRDRPSPSRLPLVDPRSAPRPCPSPTPHLHVPARDVGVGERGRAHSGPAPDQVAALPRAEVRPASGPPTTRSSSALARAAGAARTAAGPTPRTAPCRSRRRSAARSSGEPCDARPQAATGTAEGPAAGAGEHVAQGVVVPPR